VNQRELEDNLPHIRKTVRRIARDNSVVDDITQECCVRIIEKNSLWDSKKGHFKSWIAKLSQNITFRFLKRRSHISMETLDDENIVQNCQRDFDDEDVVWLLNQFVYLTKKQREVLFLKYYENMKTNEIAKKLNITPAAVSQRLTDAVKKLKQKAKTSGLMAGIIPCFDLIKMKEVVIMSSKIKMTAVTIVVLTIGIGSYSMFSDNSPDNNSSHHTTLSHSGSEDNTTHKAAHKNDAVDSKNHSHSSSENNNKTKDSNIVNHAADNTHSSGKHEEISHKAADDTQIHHEHGKKGSQHGKSIYSDPVVQEEVARRHMPAMKKRYEDFFNMVEISEENAATMMNIIYDSLSQTIKLSMSARANETSVEDNQALQEKLEQIKANRNDELANLIGGYASDELQKYEETLAARTRVKSLELGLNKDVESNFINTMNNIVKDNPYTKDLGGRHLRPNSITTEEVATYLSELRQNNERVVTATSANLSIAELDALKSKFEKEAKMIELRLQNYIKEE